MNNGLREKALEEEFDDYDTKTLIEFQSVTDPYEESPKQSQKPLEFMYARDDMYLEGVYVKEVE